MEKTIGLLLTIGLGILLQRQISHPDQLKGLKVVILSLALPATIFVALMGVNFDSTLLTLPLLGIGINAFLILIFFLITPLMKGVNQQKKRTILMLLPSLAPGLSCFPFISEYLGDEPLAYAALMDVGNKFFVLIILYLLAMKWYFQFNRMAKDSKKEDIKKMLVKMITEPINLIMIIAIILLSLGINLETLPPIVSSTFLRLSSIMAPLVLLFIGLAVKIKKGQIGLIFQLLSFRSGILFIGSALFIYLVPNLSPSLLLLAIVFPQSSSSFWPFAHISLINSQEEDKRKTFDVEFALAILAFSLPFSSLIIMGTLSFPSISANPNTIGLIGLMLVVSSFVPQLGQQIKGSTKNQRRLAELRS